MGGGGLMTAAQLVVMSALLAQTGALFFWGGRITQMLKEHERRITTLELTVERRREHT